MEERGHVLKVLKNVKLALREQKYIEIKNLPESAQNIMMLALNGLKNNEIASELGISINTVKTQKKIAYTKLKNKIGPLLQAVLLAF